jgi:hypothetical protein
MAGLVPAIHVFATAESKTWMPGTGPGMTRGEIGCMSETLNSHSPNARDLAKLSTIGATREYPLTSGARSLCFAQPLGSLGLYMRNIITKLLIVIVSRRTAGDG